MITLLSPAKTMDFGKTEFQKYTMPEFNEEAWQLVKKLKRLSKPKLKDLMSISDKLTSLNYKRYKEYAEQYAFNENAKQAILAYRGDVYTGLDADTLSKSELIESQSVIRILSGLYGILRPLDLIQPYRLEMKIPLKIQRNKNLYEFWGNTLSQELNNDLMMEDNPLLVNLASNEYFKAINPDIINAPILKVDFRERRDGKVKFISFNAKKARGLMTRFILKEGIEKKEHLKAFDYDDYVFNVDGSDENSFLFIKE